VKKQAIDLLIKKGPGGGKYDCKQIKNTIHCPSSKRRERERRTRGKNRRKNHYVNVPNKGGRDHGFKARGLENLHLKTRNIEVRNQKNEKKAVSSLRKPALYEPSSSHRGGYKEEKKAVGQITSFLASHGLLGPSCYGGGKSSD